MASFVELHEMRHEWERIEAKPLDDAVWQAWVEKGSAQDRRSSATFMKAVKWTAILALLTAALLWVQPAPYDLALRFVVAALAALTMSQAFHERHYVFASVFLALALLYNPVMPVFGFSGNGQRALLIASAVPFVASLAWRTERTEQND